MLFKGYIDNDNNFNSYYCIKKNKINNKPKKMVFLFSKFNNNEKKIVFFQDNNNNSIKKN